jgi:hypothetical protein
LTAVEAVTEAQIECITAGGMGPLDSWEVRLPLALGDGVYQVRHLWSVARRQLRTSGAAALDDVVEQGGGHQRGVSGAVTQDIRGNPENMF